MASSAWPRPDEAPAEEDLARCVHCGLCLNSCPTYAVTGLETESPRGRIYLARGVADGVIPLTATVQGHWDLCLQCRACEAVCPSSVPYGRIMEHVRAQLDADAPIGKRSRAIRRFLLRNVVARPRVLALACLPARWFANFGLRSPLTDAMHRVPGLRRLAQLEAQLPRHIDLPVRPGDAVDAVDARAEPAVLFTGCIMGEMFGGVHRATARVLGHCGIRAEAPTGQGCCGALHAHDGDIDFARKLARANIDALESTGDVPIVVNSAGCGAAMKEYGDLLSADARYAERARRFSARVRDFSEVVAGRIAPGAAKLSARVTYQDPCHLAHAQRIREQPRALLGAVDGCELVETRGGDMCCGAAGLYSLLQPQMSAELRSRKAAQFRQHSPNIVVTANPGCQMQYEAAVREAGIDARVMHIAELLDEALGNADARRPVGS